jgi:hypothetical protein
MSYFINLTVTSYYNTTEDENEIILVDVLNALYQALSTLMPVERRCLMDKLDTVLLALDELVDGGVILEIEPSAIVNRVGMRGELPDFHPCVCF